MIGRAAVAALLLFWIAGQAAGQDYQLHGFADFRVDSRPSERSFLSGGLDKLRYRGSGGATADLGQLSLIGDALLTPELGVYAHLRYAPDQASVVDLVESYIRYRPVSTTRWRWSVKLGAFFPPISLENDAIGWTPYWTETPSAINSWVGEELRTIGGEATLEWRGDENRLQATLALFAANDPAGVLLADRGWAFDDIPTGLFDRTRLPDVVAATSFQGTPLFAHEFTEFDDHVGWYGGFAWQSPLAGRFSLLRYDNRADPSAFDKQFAWHTDFWSLGWQHELAGFTLLAQAMWGRTVIVPFGEREATKFQSAYLLVGRELGDWAGAWRAALRLDFFGITGYESGPESNGEHGNALTGAVVWRPFDWMRVTGEIIHINAHRPQRLLAGLASHNEDTRGTLSVKLIY